jgi:hypothetical protein
MAAAAVVPVVDVVVEAIVDAAVVVVVAVGSRGLAVLSSSILSIQ